jgi:hypothetical protein
MTDPKTRESYDYEALRGLVAFCAMLFVFAICMDVGYMQAEKNEMEVGISSAAMTAVEVMPDAHKAVTVAMNVANSQGLQLYPWEISTDPDRHWLEIDKSTQYDTMYLRFIGIKSIPINVHVFDFKPGT